MSMFSKLWNDDEGAVLSIEMILIIGIMVFGIIPGMVAIRNSVNAALGSIGNLITNMVPSFTYSGFAITNVAGTTTIASVSGFATTTNTVAGFGDVQVAPIPLTFLTLSPAP